MSMALIVCEDGKQQYTLKVTDPKTKQTNLASYNGNPILTTYHEVLVDYTVRLVNHFPKLIYTICMVTEAQCAEVSEAYAGLAV